MVLAWLKEVNLKLNLSKCIFAIKNIIFLIYVVNKNGTIPSLQRIKVFSYSHVLILVNNMCTFLGLTRYYCNYVKGYAKVVTSLFEQKKKDVDSRWTPICEGTFKALKKTLIRALILYRPSFSKALVLDVDWSIRGVGTILF
jgi:hypothetical protein